MVIRTRWTAFAATSRVLSPSGTCCIVTSYLDLFFLGIVWRWTPEMRSWLPRAASRSQGFFSIGCDRLKCLQDAGHTFQHSENRQKHPGLTSVCTLRPESHVTKFTRTLAVGKLPVVNGDRSSVGSDSCPYEYQSWRTLTCFDTGKKTPARRPFVRTH